MRYSGKVLWYKRSKGIGLIETHDIKGIDEVYLCKAEIKDPVTILAAKEKSFIKSDVTFETAPGATRGLQAVDIRLAP